jgi:hypothetical protein
VQQQQRRWDDSWGLTDWLEAADTVFDFGTCVLDLVLNGAEAALQGAAALFSLLDGF